MTEQKPKKSFFDRGFFPILAMILFIAIFTGMYVMGKDAAIKSSGIGGNETFANIIKNYGILMGIALGIIALFGTYILFLVKTIFGLRRFVVLNPFVYGIMYGSFFWLSWWLAFFEPRYTELGRAIIDLYARPLLYASGGIICIAILRFLFLIIKKLLGKKS